MTRSSVIVVAYNGEGFLRGCLDSISGQLGQDDELIVVDNGSSDHSAAMARAHYPRARMIETGRNLGYAGGCNAGLREAGGGYLVLANQDIVALDGWLKGLLEALEWDSVGVAGCKLLFPDGRIQHAGGTVSYPLALPDLLGRGQPDRGQWDVPRDVDYVMGAALAVRREVMDRIGAFDEGFYPAYYEETDLCYRTRMAGYRVVYAPRSVAVHQESTSVVRESAEYHRWMARGRLRFVLKHYTLPQFNTDFVPAEREWLGQVASAPMRKGLRDAYLDALLGLHAIPRGGVLGADTRQERVAEALIGLRDLLAEPASERQSKGEDVGSVEPSWQIEEQPFRSDVAIIGPLIAGFRTLWNSVSTKWYVRSLVGQQNEVNRQIAARLRQQEEASRETAARLEQVSEEVAVAQALLVRLDGEAVDARAAQARAVHRLNARLERLERSASAPDAADGAGGEGWEGM